MSDALGIADGEERAWALEHLHEQFDVETLAARAYMSRRTFDRRFRSLTGSAPLQWLITLIAASSAGTAIMLFGAMLAGAWPTYGAHLLTAIAAVIAIVQLVTGPARRR